MSYRDLREWLEQVDGLGELRTVPGCDWNLEIGALAEVAGRGRDAPAIRSLVEGHVPVASAGTMAEAVARAREAARPGDAVLLSPACASWDMYGDYRERGRDYRAEALAGGGGGPS